MTSRFASLRAPASARLAPFALVAVALVLSACSSRSASVQTASTAAPAMTPSGPPSPDPRVGLGAGVFDAEEAIWNLAWGSQTPPPESFVGSTNSDLAFLGDYAIQGNYDGVMVWDISDPANPTLAVEYVCPASQSDVSVYGNLLFVSGEGTAGRLDCSDEGVQEAVSHHRLRGIRIFDISDIRNPDYVANVQTCRGSHTHSVLKHPGDDDNVYIYVSGSAPVRPAEELPGCVAAPDDPNSALFRIEVIRVPLDSPEDAAIVSSPRIFQDLVAPPVHGASPADRREAEEAEARGEFIAEIQGQVIVLPPQFTGPQLTRIVRQRGGTGEPTAADSATLREEIPGIIEQMVAAQGGGDSADPDAPRPGPTQCHDITLYPAIGLAGGACGGYGLLLDITDPENPVRIDAVADSNFSYWHSATFNNDGSKVLFTDEWGGGGGPKCRIDDPYEWGADAIFTIENGKMVFHQYFKLPAAQTSQENCVAHNGSLIPIPGRDVMVQGWYQGGINIFDWTDPKNPHEIAFHDRGPLYADRMQSAGSWSVYWYNGVIVNSEIARGLDIFELVPSDYLTQNEIDAAKSAMLEYLNAQGQPQYEWPASFALAGAYVDQLERSGGLSAQRIAEVRSALSSAQGGSRSGLSALSNELHREANSSSDADRVHKLASAVGELAG
jgi:hypothetical protein